MDFDMDVERLIGSVLRGTLTGRRKRTRGVQRLLGRRGGGLFSASSLLGLAGIAWGVYETALKKTTVPEAAAPGPAGPWTPAPPREVVPPVPAASGAGAAPAGAAVPEGVLRVIRVTLSAARADGTLTDTERESILSQARQVGAETIVTRELESPAPLAQVVAGVTDPTQREDLYTLAFAIVRADEAVTGGERVYLAQLAHHLGFDPETAARLEEQAARRIDDASRQADAGE